MHAHQWSPSVLLHADKGGLLRGSSWCLARWAGALPAVPAEGPGAVRPVASPYAHRCPQRRWPMLPATCAWPRTPRALWRSSLPSGCKVSCGEQATPGDSAAEQGPMLRARPNAGRHSTSSTPRATSLCLRCPRPWVCTQHLGILVWHQPPPETESIWGTLITESQPQMTLSDFGGLTASL